jgi:hypothetical protein
MGGNTFTPSRTLYVGRDECLLTLEKRIFWRRRCRWQENALGFEKLLNCFNAVLSAEAGFLHPRRTAS